MKSLEKWVKYFSDNWIVSSELTTKEIYGKITEAYENKTILIIELSTTNYYSKINTKVWEFIKSNKKK